MEINMNKLKDQAKGYLVIALLLSILGIILIVNEENFLNISISVLGYLGIFIGILHIVYFFRLDDKSRYYNSSLVKGILLTSFGCISFMQRDLLRSFLIVIIASYIMYINSINANESLKLKYLYPNISKYLLIISLVNVFLGFLIITNPISLNISTHIVIALLIIISEVLLSIESFVILLLKNKGE